MAPDTTFHDVFSEVLHRYSISAVNDTIIVFSDQVSENNPYRFKAYSTNTFNYLGAFIRNGRGPGEMLSPRMVSDNANEECLCLATSDYASYIVDVEKSIETGQTAVVHRYDLPSGTIDWLPLSDSEHFILQKENRELVFHTIAPDGTVHRTFPLYKGLDHDRYMTHLSSILVNNGKTGQVAEVMLMFPQINFIDTHSEKVYSVAVNKDYRKWQSVLDRMFDAEMVQYYDGATATSDYIFAIYRCLPLGKFNNPDYGSSIHVFDWDGKFLYDVRVAENISYITFDKRSGFLYCITKPEDLVVRYDLGGLLGK